MSNQNFKTIHQITDTSINAIAFFAVPLNIIIYFALLNSAYSGPRILPPIMGIIVIALALLKHHISFHYKIWTLISLVFLAACFNLLLGLLDMAGLWFILAIIYTLFISQKQEALIMFLISFLAVLVTGVLMMSRVTFIPLDYGFDNCQFACVAVRILHFLLIGYLVYRILTVFFNRIKNNVRELAEKAQKLEMLNISLSKEMKEKKAIQEKMMDAIISTEEKERKRLASDLHDGLGPVLSAINLYFDAYRDAAPGDKPAIENKLQEVINNAIADVSRISHNISPHVLENHGLTEGLNNFIAQIHCNGKFRFITDFDTINRFEAKKELAVYRNITELINNSLKHSGATEIHISIKKEGTKLSILYSDNGKGFHIEHKNKGMGLTNITNRMESIHGKVSFISNPEEGMQAQLTLNIKDGE